MNSSILQDLNTPVINYSKKQIGSGKLAKEIVVYSLGDKRSEQTLLGGLVYSYGYTDASERLESVIDILKPEYFVSRIHQLIYKVILELSNEKNPTLNNIEALVLTSKDFLELVKLPDDKDIINYIQKNGILDYLKEYCLTRYILGVTDMSGIAEDIKDYYQRREISKTLERCLSDVSTSMAVPCVDLVSNYEAELSNIIRGSEGKSSDFQPVYEILRDFDKNFSQDYVKTGLKELDGYINGFGNSHLIIVGARPAMGKTAFALSVALNIAKSITKTNNGHYEACVGLYSIEMTKYEIISRMLSTESQIPKDKWANQSYKIDNEESNDVKIDNAKKVISNLPFLIDEAIKGRKLNIILRRIRRFVVKKRAKIVFIDYLGLIEADTKRNQNKTYEIQEITTSLKSLAKELNIPIVLLCQVNRESIKRENKRPLLGDLKDSGSIEQDADVVLLLHREEYYLRDEEPQQGLPDFDIKYKQWKEKLEIHKGSAEIIVAKNRHGATGIAKVKFNSSLASFY